MNNEEKILSILETLVNDMQEVKNLKQDMQEVKQEVKSLKQEVKETKHRLIILENTTDRLAKGLGDSHSMLYDILNEVRGDIRSLKQKQEKQDGYMLKLELENALRKD